MCRSWRPVPLQQLPAQRDGACDPGHTLPRATRQQPGGPDDPRRRLAAAQRPGAYPAAPSEGTRGDGQRCDTAKCTGRCRVHRPMRTASLCWAMALVRGRMRRGRPAHPRRPMASGGRQRREPAHRWSPIRGRSGDGRREPPGRRPGGGRSGCPLPGRQGEGTCRTLRYPRWHRSRSNNAAPAAAASAGE